MVTRDRGRKTHWVITQLNSLVSLIPAQIKCTAKAGQRENFRFNRRLLTIWADKDASLIFVVSHEMSRDGVAANDVAIEELDNKE